MEEAGYDVVVIGGGPAGSAAAITAARRGGRVLLLERGRLPRHKVCGEFVSPESLRLLARLLDGAALLAQAPAVVRARLHVGNRLLQADISPSAASITRHDLDLALWRAAERSSADCHQEVIVQSVSTVPGGGFEVLVSDSDHQEQDQPGQFAPVRARAVIDATGRWSNLQQAHEIPPETWVGLKTHFETGETSEAVDLYFFPQGYCGVQPSGGGRVNACAMVRARAGIGNSLEPVFALHPELWRRSRDWSPVMATVATAPLFFRSPQPVRGTVLLAGDAAGFIDPFVGDGISMALRSGTLAAESLASCGWSTERGARVYAQAYGTQFLPVFRNAARVRRLLTLDEPLRGGMIALGKVPGLAEYVLRSTRLQFPACGD